MKKVSPWRDILDALIIIVIGFVLINLVFGVVFGGLGQLFVWLFGEGDHGLLNVSPLVVGAIIIGTITWLVIRSKMPLVFKASWMIVPSCVGVAVIGLLMIRWSYLAIGVPAIAVLAALYQFNRSKQPWQYYFAVIISALALLTAVIFGVDI